MGRISSIRCAVTASSSNRWRMRAIPSTPTRNSPRRRCLVIHPACRNSEHRNTRFRQGPSYGSTACLSLLCPQERLTFHIRLGRCGAQRPPSSRRHPVGIALNRHLGRLGAEIMGCPCGTFPVSRPPTLVRLLALANLGLRHSCWPGDRQDYEDVVADRSTDAVTGKATLRARSHHPVRHERLSRGNLT